MKKFLFSFGCFILAFIIAFFVFCLDCFYTKDLSYSDVMSLFDQPRDDLCDLSLSLGVLYCVWTIELTAFLYDLYSFIPWKRIFKKKSTEDKTDSPT